jgi:hypothetical protein
MKIPVEAIENMKRRTLDLRVEKGINFQLIGKIVATSIKKMEEQPELSAQDTLSSVILEETQNDPKIAAQLDMRYGEYINFLSQGHGAKYFDLQVVHVNNGQPGPSFEEACRLKQELAAILGDKRIKICSVIEGEAAKSIRDSIMRGVEETRDDMLRM